MKNLLIICVVCLLMSMSLVSCEQSIDCLDEGADYCAEVPLGVVLIPQPELFLSLVDLDENTGVGSAPEGSIEIPIYRSETSYRGTAVILDITKKMPALTTEYVMDSSSFVSILDVARELPTAGILNDGHMLQGQTFEDLPVLEMSIEFRDLIVSKKYDKPIIRMKKDGSATMVIVPELLDRLVAFVGYGNSPANPASPQIPNHKKFPRPRDRNSSGDEKIPGDGLNAE